MDSLNIVHSQQHTMSYIIPLLLMMIYFSIVGWQTDTFCFFMVLCGLYYATIHGGPYATPIILVALMLIHFWMAFWYKQKYGQYRSTPESVKLLQTIRRQQLSTAIDPLVPNVKSVCKKLLNGSDAYALISPNATALVNWRPLTVRLAGYLGGISSTYDGVFDMTKGTQLALAQGARAFVFDIDYLDTSPCNPVIINRDDGGYMRSLHTGSIKEACQTLKNKAFETNYDPVIIIVYMRRLPSGTQQKASFLSAIAQQLNPLSMYHLGSTEQGNFYNCLSESILFLSPITNYQKKFIVLTNYDTTTLPSSQNPTDNLNFWTNARIYRDPSGLSSSLGDVTPPPPPSPPAYAQVGSAKQLLNIGKADQNAYIQGTTTSSANTFKIALGAVDYSFSTAELTIMLNQLGIQCVPIDVVALSALPKHEDTIKNANKTATAQLSDLAMATNPDDPLSFWAYSGWSRKLLKDEPSISSTNTPVTTPQIQGYIVPKPTIPTAPSAATNSQGGLVSIA